MGTNSGESGARNLEVESIRSGAESMGGCVKLKTVIEIRQSSDRDTFIAEGVYFVLNSLLDWKPMEKLKQRCYVVSFAFFSMRRAAQCCITTIRTICESSLCNLTVLNYFLCGIQKG